MKIKITNSETGIKAGSIENVRGFMVRGKTQILIGDCEIIEEPKKTIGFIRLTGELLDIKKRLNELEKPYFLTVKPVTDVEFIVNIQERVKRLERETIKKTDTDELDKCIKATLVATNMKDVMETLKYSEPEPKIKTIDINKLKSAIEYNLTDLGCLGKYIKVEYAMNILEDERFEI